MKKNFILTLVMVLVVVKHPAIAASVTYQQVSQVKSSTTTTTTTQPANGSGQVPGTQASDPPQIKTVRLSDGREVDFGPGVICSDACIEANAMSLLDAVPAEAAPPSSSLSTAFWIAVPILGGVVVYLLLRGGTPTLVVVPGGGTTPGGNTPGAAVSEPTTLLLLGSGLASVAAGLRRRRKKM